MAHQDSINAKFIKAAAHNDLAALNTALTFRDTSYWTGETLGPAQVSATDRGGRTALIWAALKGHQQMAAYLAKLYKSKNAELIKACDKQGNTALHAVCEHSGHADLMCDLIDLGLDVNQANYRGQTPLILAIQDGQGHLVQHLIARGADVNKQDNEGKSPLIWAIERCKKHLVEELLAAKADPNLYDNRGDTPLHRVLSLCNYSNVSNAFVRELAALLIEKGADATRSNNQGTKLSDHGIISGIINPKEPGPGAVSQIMKKVFKPVILEDYADETDTGAKTQESGDKDPIRTAFIDEGLDPAADEHWRAIGQSVIEHVIGSVDNPRILSTTFNFTAQQCTTQVRNILTGKVTANTVESIEGFGNPTYVAEAHEKLVAMGKTPPPLPQPPLIAGKKTGLGGKL